MTEDSLTHQTEPRVHARVATLLDPPQMATIEHRLIQTHPVLNGSPVRNCADTGLSQRLPFELNNRVLFTTVPCNNNKMYEAFQPTLYSMQTICVRTGRRHPVGSAGRAWRGPQRRPGAPWSGPSSTGSLHSGCTRSLHKVTQARLPLTEHSFAKC